MPVVCMQRRRSDAVYKFLRLRTGQRGAEKCVRQTAGEEGKKRKERDWGESCQGQRGDQRYKPIIQGHSLVEPDDSVEVQVVGGLVQHQQRGFHEQRPRGWVAQGRVSGRKTLANPQKSLLSGA